MTCILAITTYNRLERLKLLLSSFSETCDRGLNWQVVIADDGSTDGTLEYIESLDGLEIHLIKNNRQGIHHQTNSIFQYIETLRFDICFKCDDDITFKKQGWDRLYIDAIKESGFDHICYFNSEWRPHEVLSTPIEKGTLISHVKPLSVQGAFYTITPSVLNEIGYMDTKSFGFRGLGHIDYTIRASRAGFNDPDHPFDVTGSDQYIGMNLESYNSALPDITLDIFESEAESKRKQTILMDPSRKYIPYKPGISLEDMDLEPLLKTRNRELRETVAWYDQHYGHQPKWFVRLGKLIFNPKSFSEKAKYIYEVSVKRVFKKL